MVRSIVDMAVLSFYNTMAEAILQRASNRDEAEARCGFGGPSVSRRLFFHP